MGIVVKSLFFPILLGKNIKKISTKYPVTSFKDPFSSGLTQLVTGLGSRTVTGYFTSGFWLTFTTCPLVWYLGVRDGLDSDWIGW